MSRDSGNFDPTSSGSRGMGHASYKSSVDTLAQISAAGYFNKDWTAFRHIELLDVYATDGFARYRPTASLNVVALTPYQTLGITTLTQAAYDALAVKDPKMFYVIVG